MLERSRETLFVLIKYRSQTMKKIKKFPTIIVAVMEKDCEDENMKIQRNKIQKDDFNIQDIERGELGGIINGASSV